MKYIKLIIFLILLTTQLKAISNLDNLLPEQNAKSLLIQPGFLESEQKQNDNFRFLEQDFIPNDTTVLQPNTNTPLTIEQTTETKYFTLDIPNDTDKFYLIEVRIDDSDSYKPQFHDLNPVLILSQEAYPQLGIENGVIKDVLPDNTRADANSYFQEKSYHSILLNPSEQSEFDTTTWKILFQVAPNSLYTYDISVTESQSAQCPNKCSNPIGTCIANDTYGECQCNQKDRIDLDCSLSAQYLEKDRIYTLQGIPDRLSYYYFQMPNDATYRNKDMQLSIRLPSDKPIVIYILFEKLTVPLEVPTPRRYSDIIVLNKKEQLYRIPNVLLVGQGLSYKMVLGVQSLTASTVVADVLVQQYVNLIQEQPIDSNMMIVYFLLGVAGILFIIWIILTIIRIKYGNQQVQLQQYGLARRRRQQQVFTLTPEVIEKYMPAFAFEIIKTKITRKLEDDESCSVCLIEFEDSDMVRQTICEHLFHQECLEQWLGKHENCPLCREDFTKKKLNEYYKKQNQLSKMDGEDEEEDEEEGDDEGTGQGSQQNGQPAQNGQINPASSPQQQNPNQIQVNPSQRQQSQSSQASQSRNQRGSQQSQQGTEVSRNRRAQRTVSRVNPSVSQQQEPVQSGRNSQQQQQSQRTQQSQRSQNRMSIQNLENLVQPESTNNNNDPQDDVVNVIEEVENNQ